MTDMDMKNKTGAQIFKETMDKRQPLQTVVGANIHCSDQSGSSMPYVEHLERVVADLDAGEYPECGQASQTIRRLHRKYYPQNY